MRQVEDVTRGVLDWARATCPDLEVSGRSLADTAPEPGIDVRLVGVRPGLPGSGPDGVLLDYLVAIRMDDPLEEQRALTGLLRSAPTQPGLTLALDRDALGLLAGLRMPPALAIVVAADLSLERPARRGPPVRSRHHLVAGSLGLVDGRVLDPDGRALPAALVGIVGTARRTRTDAQGRFRLAAVPEGVPVRLEARAGVRRAEASAVPGSPVTILLPLEA